MGFCPLALTVPADGHSSWLALIRQKGQVRDTGRRWLEAVVEHSLWSERSLGWPADLIQPVSSHLSSSYESAAIPNTNISIS